MFENPFKIFSKIITVYFSIYLKHDYYEKHYDYEKKIYRLSQHYFSLKKTEKTERMFEILMGLGLLRYRIKDYSTFEVIHLELKNIYLILKAGLKELSFAKKYTQFEALNLAIEKLEELYRSALQVVAEDPLVFLFFIEELRSFNVECQR